ncbi:DUF4390 domain-containing protein [Comamonas serinivorans]|nr:DUF4390 domain-containing protein [Comamonas serinivorans]
MHACTSGWRDVVRAVLAPWGLALALLLLAVDVGAQPSSIQVSEYQLTNESDGLYLTAQLAITVSHAMQEALNKGVPLYFVASVQVVKERWYWRDAVLAQASRHMRLVYQPLTRRWRVNASSSPLATSGLGVSLSQYFESLDAAVAAMGRFAHWQIADAEHLGKLDGHEVQFSFDIDAKQLPRPFVIGQSGNADWALSTFRVDPVPPRTP